MNDIDRSIRSSLSSADAELFDRLGSDEAFHRQLLATLQGRFRWFNAAGGIAGVVLFGVGCFLASRFVQASDVGEMLRWGAAAMVAFTGLALVKLWFWLELQKNAVVQEVKRLEVQVASLAAQLRRS